MLDDDYDENGCVLLTTKEFFPDAEILKELWYIRGAFLLVGDSSFLPTFRVVVVVPNATTMMMIMMLMMMNCTVVVMTCFLLFVVVFFFWSRNN